MTPEVFSIIIHTLTYENGNSLHVSNESFGIKDVLVSLAFARNQSLINFFKMNLNVMILK